MRLHRDIELDYQTSRSEVMRAIDYDHQVLEKVKPAFQDDRDLVLAVVSRDKYGSGLRYASSHLRVDV